MNKLLLFDFNNLFYRAAAVHRNLTYKGRFTGALYGFVTQMASTINEIQPDKVIVCTDTRPYAREKFFKDYKAGRKRGERTPEEREALHSNSAACKDVLEYLGIPFLSMPGLEADDLFAMIAKKHSHKWHVIIASNDSDLYQILDYAVMYRGKEKGYYTRREFFREYHQLKRTKDWAKVTAIAGSHNGVPQIVRNVGPKTAIKMLTLRSQRKALEAFMEQHEATYERNYHLCILPYPGSGRIKELPPQAPCDFRGVVRYLSQFGIEYTGYMAQAFEG